MLKIEFMGAAKTVTGSSYLVRSDKATFLVDCGMFQGEDVEARNLEDFDYSPEELDFVIITHSHIDHIGMIPKLIRRGFRGEIYLTQQSANLAYHLLLDAAKIQENSYRDKASKKSLFDTTDALEAIASFRSYDFDKEVKTKQGVKIVFEKAGHVLGAASVAVNVDGKSIYFSGDIGRESHPFIEGFDSKKRNSDYIVMEALYGGKFHEDRDLTVDQLISAINLTLERNGNVIIPAFSLQRTQELLYILKRAYLDNRIKRKVVVYLDSPLAIKITEEYARSTFLNNEVPGVELFRFNKLRTVMKARRSLAKGKESKIVIAGSGMCDGGRILNHLKRNLPNPKNSVLIVGFQAEGTLGRELVEGAKAVLIDKKRVDVRAQIHTFFGFSAHGDDRDLNSWLSRFGREQLKKVFLVHAEEDRMKTFASENSDLDIEIPDWKEKYLLD